MTETTSPGPFKATGDVVRDADNNLLAQVWGKCPEGDSTKRRNANTKLLAASFAYHAAVEKIRQCVEGIKKAERGQGFGGCPFVIPADLIEDLLDAHKKAGGA